MFKFLNFPLACFAKYLEIMDPFVQESIEDSENPAQCAEVYAEKKRFLGPEFCSPNDDGNSATIVLDSYEQYAEFNQFCFDICEGVLEVCRGAKGSQDPRFQKAGAGVLTTLAIFGTYMAEHQRKFNREMGQGN